jgi:serine-type D-Ala-D-Ala carboxypeptidase
MRQSRLLIRPLANEGKMMIDSIRGKPLIPFRTHQTRGIRQSDRSDIHFFICRFARLAGIAAIMITFLFNEIILSQPLPVVSPSNAGMDEAMLSRVDNVINESIADGETPGAVLLIMRRNRIVWRKAYGNRQQEPVDLPMTTETIFDMASVTKPVVTATAIMQLVDAGKVRLSDPVSFYLPGFIDRIPAADGSITTIRLIHLLTHTSGMPGYPPVENLVITAGTEPATRLQTIYSWLDTTERLTLAGESFLYSCPNFVSLQRIVEVITGESLADYARSNIFEPLFMDRSSYNPPVDWKAFTAPTEAGADGEQMICVVHDPFARELMGGISGNAGLFSTADDLAVFSAMMLNGGEKDGRRILSPASVALPVTSSQTSW